MHLTYNGLSPYFDFIVKCLKKIEEKTIAIDLEKIDINEIISEEIYLVKKNLEAEENQDLIEAETIIENYFENKFKNFINVVRKKNCYVFRIKEKDDELFENEKESFLSSEEIYFVRKSDTPKTKIIGVYEPYNLVAIEYVPKNSLEKETITVYIRSYIYVLKTILDALKILQDKPKEQNRVLLKLIENKEYVSFDNTIFADIIREKEWLFLNNIKRDGTKQQREFVNIAITTSDFAILEGPPGSGKTTTICEIIYQAIRRGQRVLLVASTHVAVDNVLEKLFDEELKTINEIKETILPIRIGKHDDWKISDLASKYQFENFWEEDKKLLINSLENFPNKTESQKLFLDLPKKKDGNEYISQAFLKAANLVCGTTIGILRHPEIGNLRRKEQISQPFDMIILDEASKTTFQEFLVPALAAKKFVIVGDIMQLPPYVDEEGVSSNLEYFSVENNSLVNLFMNFNGISMSGKFPKRCLIIDNRNALSNSYKLLEYHYDCPTCILYEDKVPDLSELWGASIIIGSEKAIERNQHLLPCSLHLFHNSNTNLIEEINPEDINLTVFKYKHNHFSNKLSNDSFHLNFQDESWEHSIGWRLNRSFEHRFLKENIYDKQIEERIPKWISKEDEKKLYEFLDDIKKIAFPSIIELLQKGFKSRHTREKTILNDGFEGNDLRLRHRTLLYQHRMHPDISSFSRENFYNSKALLDCTGIETERIHNISRYQKHFCWLDVKIPSEYRRRSRNQNKYEAKAIMQEIDFLRKWFRNNPKRDGYMWTIAVLPFYKSQENLLRMELQSKFKSKRYRTFIDKTNNCKIELCVIDRFQGHEADFVFLSFVQNSRIGFLDSPNRLNVALTRGKYQVIVVGDKDFFEKDRHRSDLLRNLARNTKPIRLLNEVNKD